MANNEFITPAKAARGLGSARAGTHDHIRQRVTAIALVFLVPWFIFSVISATNAGYESAAEWAGKPWNAILLILTAGATFYHMRIGMQIIIEDYIAKTSTRTALLILNSFAAIALFVTVALSVLKLWIGAGA
ncbi:succinate dehydrogenase, hydrophobic membrane anchor protein [Hyphomonas johnsonii]|jgi:succinate dehydrogenase / fumarate reductase membrane anchor subunit|uniref:Succinate dehydrogenase hydrophobic membrane anchor subunit n=1 Tax=Hyphomonas johnsonii MHS-2 TaxID=1280950 RepID=A0A059FMD8_9PROT|nr:succinate dehydrogenase, hydrophobic membrane anchor protein [Hyphomonas johnsonii]KCZ91613.1 succinate dehydrogenase, hydrophobic membrane anchor protein [Hyphomonas johnsonii MHS-2]